MNQRDTTLVNDSCQRQGIGRRDMTRHDNTLLDMTPQDVTPHATREDEPDGTRLLPTTLVNDKT